MHGKIEEMTQLEALKGLRIEQILRKNEAHYSLGLQETQLVITKCESVIQIAALHRAAFKARQHSEYNDSKHVSSAVMDAIYVALLKGISSFLQETSAANTHRLGVFKTLDSLLEGVSSDRSNSEERIFLRKKLEVEWRKLARNVFNDIDSQQDSVMKARSYESLILGCHPQDEILWEIAEKCNAL